jgi:hypothetical protein
MMSIDYLLVFVGSCQKHLPDANPSSSSGSECDAVLGPRQPGLGQGWSLDGALMVSGPRRSMPHMARQEWYETYRTQCPPGSVPSSRRTFDRAYRGWITLGNSEQNPIRQMRDMRTTERNATPKWFARAKERSRESPTSTRKCCYTRSQGR